MMMKAVKKALCVVLSVVLLCVLAGCSTPKVAMTVDGREFETGEYLAYLYNTYAALYNNSLSYYSYYGMDPWSQTFPYGEDEKNQEQLGLSDYIVKTTQDTIIRQKALENLMAKYKITLSEDDEKDYKEQMKQITDSQVLDFGFSAESYGKMAHAYNYNEKALFDGLYAKGGLREVSRKELRQYILKNYISYQMLSIALKDADGNELDSTVKKAVEDFMTGYLHQYEQSGDMTAVFEAYKAAIAQGAKLMDDKGKLLATLTFDGANVVVTTGDKEPAEATSESTPACNRVNQDQKDITDEDLLAALKAVKEGKAAVRTYAAGGSTDTVALIVRYAPLEGSDAVNIKDETETVLYNAKFDEFDKEVKAEMKKLDVTVNERAVSMCKPEYFDPDYEEGQTTTTTTTTTAVSTGTAPTAATTAG